LGVFGLVSLFQLMVAYRMKSENICVENVNKNL